MVRLEIRETGLCSFFRMLWIIKWFTTYFYGRKYLNKSHNSGVFLIFVPLQIFLMSHNIFNDFHQYVQWPTNLKRIWSKGSVRSCLAGRSCQQHFLAKTLLFPKPSEWILLPDCKIGPWYHATPIIDWCVHSHKNTISNCIVTCSLKNMCSPRSTIDQNGTLMNVVSIIYDKSWEKQQKPENSTTTKCSCFN